MPYPKSKPICKYKSPLIVIRLSIFLIPGKFHASFSRPTFAFGMNLKDYYEILELKPSATPPEIKKAWRKLAQQYHPDKTNNDPYAVARFTAIKEAYEILTNPSKKEYYLQQRWYHQSMGKKFSGNVPVTPPAVLKQCLELNRYVATLDIHRMDKEGLAGYITDILTDSTLQQLQTFGETGINQTIIISVLKTIEPLKKQQAEKVMSRLFKLADTDTESKNLINTAIDHKAGKERLENYQPFLIILITVLICLLIYLVSR